MSTTMEKKPRAGQQRFKGDGFPVPDPELEAAASAYSKALTAETNAKAKRTSQKETLLEVMERKGIDEVRVAHGTSEKIVRRKKTYSLKIEVVREAKDSPEADE